MAEIEKERAQDTFREGLFVRALGWPCSANPYPPNSNEGLFWEKGWRSVDEVGEGALPTDTTSRIKLVPAFTPGVAPTKARQKPATSLITNFLPSARVIEVLRVAAVIAMGVLMLIALHW
jgi:hypothetical protein